ncbi:MAG: hypothetical protein IJ527_08715 [Prevotella sp.]|nr:hypothetical protein [Prevotella sp.]
MNRKLHFILITLSLCCCTALHAAPTYDEMKAQISSQSLPLVNLTVNISDVNRTDYVPASIEICDYQQRTDARRW